MNCQFIMPLPRAKEGFIEGFKDHLVRYAQCIQDEADGIWDTHQNDYPEFTFLECEVLETATTGLNLRWRFLRQSGWTSKIM